MEPFFGFLLGIVASNIWQWGFWKTKHQTKEDGWLGYWHMGLPHLMMNIVGDGIALALWRMELLDDIIKIIPGMETREWVNVGIPFTPQVGFMLGACVDLFSDQLVFMVGTVLGKWLPFLKPPSNGAAKEAP